MSCAFCNAEALRLKPGKKWTCSICRAERVALRRAPDRTLCGTCHADVSEFVKTTVDVPGAMLPCGHNYSPTNLVCTVKLVEATQ